MCLVSEKKKLFDVFVVFAEATLPNRCEAFLKDFGKKEGALRELNPGPPAP